MLLLSLLFIEIKALNCISCLCSELELEQECKYAGCEWNTNTNQCINRLPINQPNCSDYEDQLVCDFLQGCSWNNKGMCEQFTQCSDYVIDQYDTSDQCYLKDQTCRNGQINNQGFITCQSIDQFCNDYTNQLMIVGFDNKNYLITQEDNNQTAIIKFKQNSIDNCIIQQNSLISCSTITNEIICKFIKNKFQTLLCEWNNNQCMESIIPQQNVDNCYLQSGGTHSWQSNVCQSCKGQDLQKNKRILAEILTPTLTKSTKEVKSTQSSIKVIYPTSSYQQNCTTAILITSTRICFGEYCTQSMISKEQVNCIAYGGINYDIIQSSTQTDSLCSTDSKTLKIAKSQTYSNINLTTFCTSTTQILYYQNSTKSSATTSKANTTNTCQTQQIMNSTTTGNSYQKCNSITNVYDKLNLSQTSKCNTDTESIIQPDKQDSTLPFSFITSAQFCKQINANQSPDIDTIIQTTTTQTSLYSETNSISNAIGADSKMTQTQCKSNYTATPLIHSTNASFFNQSIHTIHKRDCETQTEKVQSSNSSLIINEGFDLEVYIFNYP